ncbi:MAG: DUF4388 domain-containing protein [Pseudomonadota bacterium]
MKNRVVLSGNLNFISLADLFQLINTTGSTGVLRLDSNFAPNPGLVFFVDGNPINAKNGELAAAEAVYSLFGWTEGEFEFTQEQVVLEKNIRTSVMALVMDAINMLDEGRIPIIGPKSEEKAAGGKGVKGSTLPVIKGPLINYMYVVNEEEFEEGDKIVVEGLHGNWFWVVLDGVVEVVKETTQGPLTILRLGVGSFIGSFASFLTGENVRSATLGAVTKVRLGLMDSQRLSLEFGTRTPVFRSYVGSLVKRLRQLTERAVEIFLKENRLEELVKGKKPLIKQGQDLEGLFRIAQGDALVVRSTDHGYVPLNTLSKGDFIGQTPFLDIGHEPYFASVFASEDFKAEAVNLKALRQDYEKLSPTFKNILENLATSMSVTTTVASEFQRKIQPIKPRKQP